MALSPSWSPVLQSGAEVLVLLVGAGLPVYEPRGLTRRGGHAACSYAARADDEPAITPPAYATRPAACGVLA